MTTSGDVLVPDSLLTWSTLKALVLRISEVSKVRLTVSWLGNLTSGTGEGVSIARTNDPQTVQKVSRTGIASKVEETLVKGDSMREDNKDNVFLIEVFTSVEISGVTVVENRGRVFRIGSVRTAEVGIVLAKGVSVISLATVRTVSSLRGLAEDRIYPFIQHETVSFCLLRRTDAPFVVPRQTDVVGSFILIIDLVLGGEEGTGRVPRIVFD